MNMRRLAPVILSFLFCTVLALGQSGTPEKFLFEFTLNWSKPFQSKVQSEVFGKEVSLVQSDLDVGSAWGPQARFLWKMSPANRLRFDLNRVDLTYEGERVIDREIDFPGVEFPIDASIESKMKASEIRLAYSYLFKIGSDRFRLGPLVDARWEKMEVSATGTLNGNNLGTGNYKGDVWGATVGAEFDSYPAEALNFYGFADWIGVGDLEGSWDIETGLRYFFKPWFGLTLAYEYTGTKIRLNDGEGFIRVQSNNVSGGVVLGF